MIACNVHTIYAATDPLNGLQNALPTIAPSSVGERLIFNTENKFNIQDPSKYLLDGHSLPLLIEELERLSEVHKEDKNLLTLQT